jgi:putative methionine-R-sulfoxide reductase with GAF domain
MNTFKGKSVYPYSVKILSFLAREKEISQGAFFVADIKDGKQVLKLISGYAMSDTESVNMILEFGEGFPGQVAKDCKLVNITNIPEGYLTIESGLGKASPNSLILFPVSYNDKVIAVIELASFREFTRDDELYFEDISLLIAEQIVKCSHG